MSKSMTAVYLLLALGVLFGGTAFGRYLGMSQFASVGAGLLPAMLLAYPLIRHWQRSRLSFKTWVLVVAVVAAAATLINAMTR